MAVTSAAKVIRPPTAVPQAAPDNAALVAALTAQAEAMQAQVKALNGVIAKLAEGRDTDQLAEAVKMLADKPEGKRLVETVPVRNADGFVERYLWVWEN